MLTGKSRVLDAKREPLLWDEMEWLFGSNFAAPDETLLSDIGHLSGVDDIKSVHGGLNALMRHKANGMIPLRPIWDEADVALDESRKHTCLYHFPAEQKGPFALICPGGGYRGVVSLTEGMPIAAALNKLGISAFVLIYRVGKDAHYPAPQDDLAQAVRVIMQNADAYNVTRENYSVWGFSAGGHLAASFGTQNMGYAHYALPAPSAIVLSYPVITMGTFAHAGSRDNLLGTDADESAVEFASVEKQVHRHYPPSYIWSCVNDGAVPFENSRLMKERLSNAGVRHRLYAAPGDVHGASLASGKPYEGWFVQAVAFWRSCMTAVSL